MLETFISIIEATLRKQGNLLKKWKFIRVGS
jgi:hypothetical protein